MNSAAGMAMVRNALPNSILFISEFMVTINSQTGMISITPTIWVKTATARLAVRPT
jgi:hypothetical protein